MTEITRTVEQMVADVDVDDDGYVRIHVTTPLTVDEARDVANAILQAACEGERYLAETSTATREIQINVPDVLAAGPGRRLGEQLDQAVAELRSSTWCATCGAAVVADPHSTYGWRHVMRPRLPIGHAATVDEGAI